MKSEKDIRITLIACSKICDELRTIKEKTGNTTNSGAVRMAIEYYARFLKNKYK